MKGLNTAPGKIKALLVMCLIGALVSTGFSFWTYSASKKVAQAVGKETVPQIIAAKNIRASLANAHSNAMKAMLTKEKTGGRFWSLYRQDMNTLHSQLVDSSKNITYGDAERLPLLAIMTNISAYEYTVGGAVSSGAEISVDQFVEANRLMQQKILPASSALGQVNLSQLDAIYGSYTKNINNVMNLMWFVGLLFLIILAVTQVYLFIKTRRIFNAGLLAATILFSVNLLYSSAALNSVRSHLYTAKYDAFDSLNSLWSARAEAYNSIATESLYLMHNGTGIVQTADTINFNLSATRLSSDNTAALAGGKFEGYLSSALKSGEQSAVKTALQQWVKYVDIEKQIRSLEYDNKHSEAIALCVGDASGQSGFEFAKFDGALGNTISINQADFDSNINSTFKTLNLFPYVTAVFLILIAAVCIWGMKARIDEFKI